jgi:hypothetical protein
MSARLKSEFDNGEDDLKLHGHSIALPTKSNERPATEFLSWHNENCFLSGMKMHRLSPVREVRSASHGRPLLESRF